MAQMAVDDGIAAIICTPHQLGNNDHNQGPAIKDLVLETQRRLKAKGIPLRVLAGADVRIEPEMIKQLRSGEVLSLADRRRHVLLELPHELYVPLEGVLDSLERIKMVGILSHPERNEGILVRREVLKPLVKRGCLMQITAGSLMGTFSSRCEEFSVWMLEQGLVHFIASDAHGVKARRPLLQRAFDKAAEIVGEEEANNLCRRFPRAVALGKEVPSGMRPSVQAGGWWSRIFNWTSEAA